MARERPEFRAAKKESIPATPEELFLHGLTNRASTHGYLRGPQQDVLRDYANKATDSPNVALELPTGTGKSAVGLLIAEWRRRRSGRPVTYLALTNQLAHQAIEEADSLGIACADITGARKVRDAAEEGRYKTGEAVGVTTYSNLFNSHPVVVASDVLVLDDVHSGGQHVISNWTVRLSKLNDPALYELVFASVRRSLTDAQYRQLTDPTGYQIVELCDLAGHPECVAALTKVLDDADADKVRFSWPLIRNALPACLVLVSPFEIVIRAIYPPTEHHAPFAQSTQRIYMSATLGSEDDLMREYGIQNVVTLRAEHPQWGRRYIFVPGLFVSDDAATEIVGDTWDEIDPRRAVLLAPSQRTCDEAFDAFKDAVSVDPVRMTPNEITESLDAFTTSDNTILTIAGRYDGLDLPGDDCRVLIMIESPMAVSELERHLRDRWKLGPLLRGRERTRLVQGLGRCTRNATDFAVVFWLGQSLINAITTSALVDGFPQDLRAELKWGIDQSKLAASDPAGLVGMAEGLLADANYRKGANEQIAELQAQLGQPVNPLEVPTGRIEIRFSQAMWDGDFDTAYRRAREITDSLAAPELTGYRAWWWYIASVAAHHAGDVAGERDCLKRAAACGVNPGWLRMLLAKRGEALQMQPGDAPLNAEAIWHHLEELGWAGTTFAKRLDNMRALLSETEHTTFHQGLEHLGRLLGAKPTRVNEQGAPDVVWTFAGDTHVALEAKSEKAPDGELSKSDVQQAKGHVEWVRSRPTIACDTDTVHPVIVSPTAKIHEAAKPHVGGVYCITLDEARALAEGAARELSEFRLRYGGKDFATVRIEFEADLRSAGLDLESIMKRMSARPLDSLI